MCRKFGIAYVLCKEGLAFVSWRRNMEWIWVLGTNTGMHVADFVKYIAQVQMDQLTTVLLK